MTTLTTTLYIKPSASAPDQWEPQAGNTFQMVDGVEYDVCCVGPSKSRFVTWAATNILLLESGDSLLLESGDKILLEAA